MLGAASAAQALSYTVTDLGTLGGTSSSGYGINNSGQVTGWSYTASGFYHAFLYGNGSMTDLGGLGGKSIGSSINDSGQVTGWLDYSAYSHAFLYSNGAMTDLGLLSGDDHSYASSINDSGQVVGVSENFTRGHNRAFLYSNGIMTDLSFGSSYSSATGINNSGQAVGVWILGGAGNVYLYNSGVMTDLGIIGGVNALNGWGGYGINNSGQVVGTSTIAPNSYQAFLYSNGAMTSLGTLGGASSYGYGINGSGQVVGWSTTASNSNHAFLYSNGVMTDLNDLINPASGWTLSYARAINDVGQIVGAGVNPAGASHAFLLTPLENIQKNLGQPMCMNSTGNPVNTGTGNKYQAETDIVAAVPFLSVTRHYNSQFSFPGPFGNNWGLYGAIKVLSATRISAIRPDQKAINFTLGGAVWTTDQDILDKLVQLASGWQLTTADNAVETYDATGKLLTIADRAGRTQTLTYTDGTAGPNGGYVLDASGNSTTTILPAGLLLRVTDATGNALNFGYDASSRIVKMTDPSGGNYLYAYDASSNLTSVTYPDGHQRIYWYNEQINTNNTNLPHALTGITDENGDRYATYQYDTLGRAIVTEHGPNIPAPSGPADKYGLAYNPDGSTTVTDPLGTARTHTFTTVLGVVKSTGVSQPGGSGCSAASSAITYDANGNVASRADFNGHQTCYAYDLARNLETARVEGLATGATCPTNLAAYTPAPNTAERKILTDWDSRFRLPVKRTEAGRETSTAYDSHGNVTSRSIKDTATGQTRTWTTAYTYHPSVPGVLVQKVEDGPRIDVADLTTTDYYAPDETCTGDPLGCRGQVRQITNALGHITTYNEYDANGRVLRTTDPNGLATAYSYSPRGWLLTRSVGSELTRFDYDYVGQLTKLTRPDGSYVNFEYDPAHRLTAIVDQAGNRLAYTLDPQGNRTHEEITGPGGSPVYYAHSRTFDALGRLWQDIGAYNQTATYYYDAQGNLKTIDGARTDVSDVTTHGYDALDRLTQTLNADGGVEQYTPNALDQTTRIVDPANQATAETVDAFGDVTRTQSADTGITTRSYDEAGNLKTETDARGVTVSYSYDALNRVTQKQSSDTATPVYTYAYDTCSKGHLCYIQRNGYFHLYFNYDSHGRLNYQLDNVADVAWLYSMVGYDPYGRLSTVTYPTGRAVTYSYDTQGRISQVATQPQSGSPVTVLARNFFYGYPFAGPQSFSYGNGNGNGFYQSRDQDYRPAYSFDGPRYKLYSYDPAGNVARILDIDNTALTYAYDASGRLVSAIDSASSGFGSLAWTYDRNGNRQSETRNAGTIPYAYSPPNWLYQKGSDTRPRTPNGNTLSTSAASFTYDGYNRLITAQTAAETTAYTYNALGQRLRKINQNGLATSFHYGPDGELLFELDQAGNTKAYVWLDGRPLARIDNDAQIYYYHVDHLGTPQAMSDAAGTTVWKAYYEPFGSATVRVNAVENNLRSPGQYSDRETGLFYNYFRDYDSTTGRYIEVDPIGIAGGLNVYTYVRGNPISRIDPLGLSDVTFDRSAGTITIYDNQGNQVGQYPAGNNTTSTSNGAWPDGTYDYSHYVPHPESGATGPYGSNGNFVFDVPGRTGMGIHSGRKGPQSKTLGCVRTTDDATDFLKRLNQTDPLKTITVK